MPITAMKLNRTNWAPCGKALAYALLASFFILWPSVSRADATTDTLPQPSPWEGSNIQFGFVMNTGNTQTKNFNGKIHIYYKKNKWAAIGKFETQFGSDRDRVNKEIYYTDGQVRYFFRPNKFLYAKANATFDKFSPYDYIIVQSVGYGQDLIKTERVTLSLQAGPGSLHSKVTATGQQRNQLILNTEADLRWQINETTAFRQQIDLDIGSPLTRIWSESSLRTNLVGHFGIQISFTVEHNTFIPPESTDSFHTDTITNIALVYNF